MAISDALGCADDCSQSPTSAISWPPTGLSDVVCNDPLTDIERPVNSVEAKKSKQDAARQNSKRWNASKHKNRLERLNVIGKRIGVNEDAKRRRHHLRRICDRAGDQKYGDDVADDLLDILKREASH